MALVLCHFGLESGEAYQLVSVACDLRITQLVDQKVGVHVMIPKAIYLRYWHDTYEVNELMNALNQLYTKE